MRTGVAAILLAVVLALAGAAAASSAPRGDILWANAASIKGEFHLTALADDGAAGGTLTLADGTKHAMYFDGAGAFADLSKKAGPGSVATAINDRHQVVGYRSIDKSPSTYDLVNPRVDAAHKPHAFLYGGGKVRLVSQASYATDVDDAGIVVGNFLAADDTEHAFAWFTGGLRWSPTLKNRFVDLGFGTANAVTNPTTSSKVAVGGSVGSAAGYWSLDVATGQFTATPLGFEGEVTSLNSSWRGTAFRVPSVADVNQVPLLVDLRNAAQTPVTVPSPFTSARLTSLNDAGVAFGDLFGANGLAGGGKWVGAAPRNPAASLPKSALRGNTITGVDAATLGGLFAGTGMLKDAMWTYIAFPSAADELSSVLAGVTQTGAAVYARGTRAAVAKALAASKGRNTGTACKAIERPRDANYRDTRKTGFYVRGNLVQALDEVEAILGCSNKIVPPRGLPFHH